MVGWTVTGIDKIPYEIMKMERAIKDIPWWNFIKKQKYLNQLSEMRCAGARIGFNKAIEDLIEIGIIKRNK